MSTMSTVSTESEGLPRTGTPMTGHPPDCEGCAVDRDVATDHAVDVAHDHARRHRVRVEPEPRREHVTTALRLAGKDAGGPPGSVDNRGSKPRHGARKPRSKDKRR